MNALIAATGLAIVVLVARDIFYELLRPTGHGTVSHLLLRGVWRLCRVLHQRTGRGLSWAGAVGMTLVLAAWCALLVLGFALVIAPFFPDGFTLQAGYTTGQPFVDALYMSIVTLTTLGYGDVVPHATWLQLILPLEALLGFSVLTAGLTWVLSLRSVLSERRALALEVSTVLAGERHTGRSLTDLSAETLAPILQRFTASMSRLRSDLVQAPATYYFHATAEDYSLPSALPSLLDLAERARESDDPQVRFHGAALTHALEGFTALLGREFLGLRDVCAREVAEAYARDHLAPTSEPDAAVRPDVRGDGTGRMHERPGT